MEITNTPEYNLKMGALQRINSILILLDDLLINTPRDYYQRLNLFRSLYNNAYPFMRDDERQSCEKMLEILLGELNKIKNGQKSLFTYYGDEFERELRNFTHSRIKIKEE